MVIIEGAIISIIFGIVYGILMAKWDKAEAKARMKYDKKYYGDDEE